MTATSSCAFHFNVGPKTKRKTTTPSSHTHTVRRRRAERLEGMGGKHTQSKDCREDVALGRSERNGTHVQSRGCRERAAGVGRRRRAEAAGSARRGGSGRPPRPALRR